MQRSKEPILLRLLFSIRFSVCSSEACLLTYFTTYFIRIYVSFTRFCETAIDTLSQLMRAFLSLRASIFSDARFGKSTSIVSRFPLAWHLSRTASFSIPYHRNLSPHRMTARHLGNYLANVPLAFSFFFVRSRRPQIFVR